MVSNLMFIKLVNMVINLMFTIMVNLMLFMISMFMIKLIGRLKFVFFGVTMKILIMDELE